MNRKFTAILLIGLIAALVCEGCFVFAIQTPNTIYGLSNVDGYLTPLQLGNGKTLTFLNDYTFGSAYFAGGNVSYPNFWFIDGYGAYADVNLVLNTWFASGVLNFTSASSGTASFCSGSYLSPTYMLGGAYSLGGSGYNSVTNVWSVNVAAGTTYAAAFTRYWGDFYIYSTDSAISAIGWQDSKFLVSFQGNAGNLVVHVGSRGPPQTVTGLSGTVYDAVSGLYSGSYGANGLVILDYTVSTGGVIGGGVNPTPVPSFDPLVSPSPTVSPLPSGEVSLGGLNLGDVAAGSQKVVSLSVGFSSSVLRVNAVDFPAEFASWFVASKPFPQFLYMGSGNLEYTLSVPVSAVAGDYEGSVTLSGADPFGGSVWATAPITFHVVSENVQAPSSAGLSPWIFVVFGAVSFVAIGALVLGRK